LNPTSGQTHVLHGILNRRDGRQIPANGVRESFDHQLVMIHRRQLLLAPASVLVDDYHQRLRQARSQARNDAARHIDLAAPPNHTVEALRVTLEGAAQHRDAAPRIFQDGGRCHVDSV